MQVRVPRGGTQHAGTLRSSRPERTSPARIHAAIPRRAVPGRNRGATAQPLIPETAMHTLSIAAHSAPAAARRFNGVSHSLLDAIGDTPLLEIEGIFAKLEFLNPSGSIKARIALYMIERAEQSGLLKPGDTIVEATSGNTGNALAMVAAVKGYRMLVVMPNGLSSERVAISRAYGAEVLLCGDFHVDHALKRAHELGAQPGFFCPSQFESEWNIEENRCVLGPEILSQLPAGRIPDALVLGVGTGGTLIGVGQAFRAVNPRVRLFAMEPAESPTIACHEVATHAIEGISDGFVPGIYQRNADQVDAVLTVSSADAVAEMKRLARQYGLLCGPSSGAHLLAATRIRARHPELATVVTVFCDMGEKYLHEHFMARADHAPAAADHHVHA
jgi:cysteine synthase A